MAKKGKNKGNILTSGNLKAMHKKIRNTILQVKDDETDVAPDIRMHFHKIMGAYEASIDLLFQSLEEIAEDPEAGVAAVDGFLHSIPSVCKWSREAIPVTT